MPTYIIYSEDEGAILGKAMVPATQIEGQLGTNQSYILDDGTVTTSSEYYIDLSTNSPVAKTDFSPAITIDKNVADKDTDTVTLSNVPKGATIKWVPILDEPVYATGGDVEIDVFGITARFTTVIEISHAHNNTVTFTVGFV